MHESCAKVSTITRYLIFDSSLLFAICRPLPLTTICYQLLLLSCILLSSSPYCLTALIDCLSKVHPATKGLLQSGRLFFNKRIKSSPLHTQALRQLSTRPPTTASQTQRILAFKLHFFQLSPS